MKKHYKITFKKPGNDLMHYCSEFADSAAEAREQAKSKWGDIRIISCVEG
ncbi:hypothetical protein R70006_03762 [Paraburkholderia domus]|nr:hypothetical protein R70006_03762 [Paraburkholderia domus]